MTIFKNVSLPSGKTQDIIVYDQNPHEIDGSHLLALPGLIDPHVHFRTPGHEYKENWETAALASLCGGFTTVFDMPNTHPSTITAQRLEEKKRLIDAKLQSCGIPLKYHLYFGAHKEHFDELAKVKDKIVALKIYMGSSTGDLLMDDESSLHAAFALAKAHDLLVCVHAENEDMIASRVHLYPAHYASHSLIRSPQVAASAVQLAISLCKLYTTRLHILHVSTKEEITLIRQAKEEGLPVTCETTPHHLFLHTQAYLSLQGKALVNPPLRESHHNQALLQAIHEGIIDTIGSDHAPHTLEEKNRPYGLAPSGMPGVETTLPLLLQAYHNKKLSLSQILNLTYHNICKIYRIPPNDDRILVAINKEKTVNDSDLKTRCGWSPFAGMTLKGWPLYAILDGNLHHLEHLPTRSLWTCKKS